VTDTQQMPKKKIQEIAKVTGRKAPKKSAAPPAGPSPLTPLVNEDLSQFHTAFENKAGRYELIRVNSGQAYYSFTNHQAKTVDATMSVVTWRKMQERADAALKETA
jgi:hypothetical protein